MTKRHKISLPDFSDLHIVVIGDIMMDRYITGAVKRISPEAPVPVVDMVTSENRPGGAANVAMNLLALGAKVTMISVTGADNDGEELINLCAHPNLHIDIRRIAGRKTTVKTRIMAGNQHLLRIDNEDKSDLNIHHCDDIFNAFELLINQKKTDGLILQDYNKGLLTDYLIKNLIVFCKGKNIPTFVDPKEKNFFSYSGCTLFKPNKKEVLQALSQFSDDYLSIATDVQSRIKAKIIMLTLGSAGLYIYQDGQGNMYDTSPRDIADVCGAGDAVISIAALCFLKNMNISEIAVLSNIAGGQVCEIPGVAVANRNDIEKELQSFSA